MIHSGTVAMRERRALRAVLFCLAVLAQLMLPAIMLRAEAIAGDLCVTGDSDTGSGPSHIDGHGKQCAHCRLHDCSSLAPPAVTLVLAEPTGFKRSSISWVAAPSLRLLRAQPPPTGPPPV